MSHPFRGMGDYAMEDLHRARGGFDAARAQEKLDQRLEELDRRLEVQDRHFQERDRHFQKRDGIFEERNRRFNELGGPMSMHKVDEHGHSREGARRSPTPRSEMPAPPQHLPRRSRRNSYPPGPHGVPTGAPAEPRLEQQHSQTQHRSQTQLRDGTHRDQARAATPVRQASRPVLPTKGRPADARSEARPFARAEGAPGPRSRRHSSGAEGLRSAMRGGAGHGRGPRKRVHFEHE
ncbi:hypothetical protein EJ06DRAFT_557312 [Trichodelitschia bisporula]|uniref:Uncharacterized protein n=1 Tax=Trichodelitschia bisporula TaxID=703511 RepID=A0A6G1HUH9_9PEZI|nr:hypothetical protein EJ06DRAFT_557312 [Trichodelitschia bisporula]